MILCPLCQSHSVKRTEPAPAPPIVVYSETLLKSVKDNCVYFLNELGGRRSYIGWTPYFYRRYLAHAGQLSASRRGARYTERWSPETILPIMRVRNFVIFNRALSFESHAQRGRFRRKLKAQNRAVVTLPPPQLPTSPPTQTTQVSSLSSQTAQVSTNVARHRRLTQFLNVLRYQEFDDIRSTLEVVLYQHHDLAPFIREMFGVSVTTELFVRPTTFKARVVKPVNKRGR